jgi:hypothetical protein
MSSSESQKILPQRFSNLNVLYMLRKGVDFLIKKITGIYDRNSAQFCHEKVETIHPCIQIFEDCIFEKDSWKDEN